MPLHRAVRSDLYLHHLQDHILDRVTSVVAIKADVSPVANMQEVELQSKAK
jgi:hypothetical protein